MLHLLVTIVVLSATVLCVVDAIGTDWTNHDVQRRRPEVVARRTRGVGDAAEKRGRTRRRVTDRRPLRVGSVDGAKHVR